MPKSDNKHAINLHNSIEKHIGGAAAEEFAEKLPLSKSADYVKKFKWANNVCSYLEERFTDDEIRKIRMDCSCYESGKAAVGKKIYETSKTLDEFCERFNESGQGFTLSTDGSVLYLFYPTCYCACVKRAGENLSKTWCYCTIGYTMKMFSHILSREVEVELLESVKTGGDRCVMKIL